MQHLADFMAAYVALHPYATLAQVAEARIYWQMRTRDAIDQQRIDFADNYHNAKQEHESFQSANNPADVDPFEYYYFPIDTRYITMYQAKRRILATYPDLYYIDANYHLRPFTTPLEWLQDKASIYSYLPFSTYNIAEDHVEPILKLTRNV